jgi:hypothetical protein
MDRADFLPPRIRALHGAESRYGPGDWYHVPPGVTHVAQFDHDTAEIEFWFTATDPSMEENT